MKNEKWFPLFPTFQFISEWMFSRVTVHHPNHNNCQPIFDYSLICVCVCGTRARAAYNRYLYFGFSLSLSRVCLACFIKSRISNFFFIKKTNSKSEKKLDMRHRSSWWWYRRLDFDLYMKKKGKKVLDIIILKIFRNHHLFYSSLFGSVWKKTFLPKKRYLCIHLAHHHHYITKWCQCSTFDLTAICFDLKNSIRSHYKVIIIDIASLQTFSRCCCLFVYGCNGQKKYWKLFFSHNRTKVIRKKRKLGQT